MAKYDIRLATTEEDKAAAYALRYALYVEGQGLFDEIADHERGWLRDEMDDEALVWVARVGDEVVGTVRLVLGGSRGFDRDTRETFDVDAFAEILQGPQIAIGSRMMVAPEHRKGTLVLSMMREGWGLAIERGVEVILGECEPHLVNTWKGLGWRTYGLCEHPVNGTLVRLAFVLGDLLHTQSLGSPLAAVLERYAGDPATAERLRQLLRRNEQVISEADRSTGFWRAVEQTIPRAELARRLGGLTDDELEALLDQGHALDCGPGSLLIRKGHVSRTLYILLTGSLVVRDEGEIIVEIDDSGEIIGEVAFFIGSERISDVLAGSEGARVLALSERSLRGLVEAEGKGAAKFLMAMTRGLCVKLRQRARRPHAIGEAAT